MKFAKFLTSCKRRTVIGFPVLTGLTLASAVFVAPALSDIGDTASWRFNLPSTSVASQNPPYPSVATLLLVETADGVQFTLTPTWNDPPAGRFGTASFIERLDYVFDVGADTAPSDFQPTYPAVPPAVPPLSNGSFRWDGGAPIKAFDYDANVNLDSGYKAEDQWIHVDFFSKNNDPDEYRFDTTFANSVWTVLGRDLIDFTATFATHNSHPTPTQGVISVTSYSLEDPKPTPSNWVTGPGGNTEPDPNGAPEPGVLALLGSDYLV